MESLSRMAVILCLAGCGQINVKGGTTNKVETTGTTRHEIVLTIDPKLCEGQVDVPDCIDRLTKMLQEFLETLNKTKELEK